MAIKLKKGEANVQKNSMSVDQAKAKILAVRNTKSNTPEYSASNPYTKPLSAQGQANVNAMFTPKKSSVSSNSKGVSSFIGTGSNYGLGTTPKLEFSVLPGAKAGPVSLGYAGQMPGSNAQSTLNPRTSEEFAKVEADQKAGRRDMITAATLPLGLGGAGARVLAQGARTGTVANIVQKAKSFADDVFKRAGNQQANVIKAVDDVPTSLGRQSVTTAFRSAPVRATISSLGALAAGAMVGSTIADDGSVSTGDVPSDVGVVRNAIPQGAATETTGTATASTSGDTTGDTTEPAPELGALSSPMGGAPSYSGSSVTSSGASPGVSGGGGYAGTATFGGQMSQAQTAAQAKAMALQRSQVDQAGVNAAPIGDQVDLAGLQALRDKAKSLLDQYGTDAVTMPEFKANVQAMIASGVENMKKIQPSPPEPVTETQEQLDFLNQIDPVQQQDIRAFMDETRRALGMPALESQRIDVMQQLNVVTETYQKVIDQIKQNPNLPSGLAGRRLNEVFEDQKFASNQLIAQLEILDQQLEDGNSRLNQEMGIFQYQATQSEKAQQRRLDQFGYLTESGAVAGLSDKEVRQWSQATGIPESAIRTMKTKASDVKTSWDISYEQNPNTGEKFAIYTDKNNPVAQPQVVSLGSFGVKSSGSGSAKEEKVIIEEKDLTRSIRTDLIDTIKANPTATIDQLESAFPEVARTLLENYLNQYGTPSTQNKETIWDKIGNWWDSVRN